MKAILYETLQDNSVKCKVCNHYCIILSMKRGKCGVRENMEGTLIALNYGLTVASSIDPIEKKPLYHYLPKTRTYSFATVGCNMDCPWCQNNRISQSTKPHETVDGTVVPPSTHVLYALEYGCPSISYTYSEPTIFLEYALEVMKEAKENELKNIWVSNGYMSKETMALILPYIDAVNIDVKGTSEIYKKYKLGDFNKVLENIVVFQKNGKHVEITTLLIPDITIDDFKQLAETLKENIDLNTPWHISRFFPYYKMSHSHITDRNLMQQAKRIAKKEGFKNVYLGNI